jgi:hypothetical protein
LADAFPEGVVPVKGVRATSSVPPWKKPAPFGFSFMIPVKKLLVAPAGTADVVLTTLQIYRFA